MATLGLRNGASASRVRPCCKRQQQAAKIANTWAGLEGHTTQ